MLVLSRRLNEKIVLPDLGVTVQVVAVKPGVVRLGIEAPPEVTVLREEVQNRQAQWEPPATPPPDAAEKPLRPLQHLLHNRLRITRAGLALLRRQLQAGLEQEAEVTLGKLEEDLDMLDLRVDGEVDRPAPAPAAGAARHVRALLVEDNANERELLATYLRTSGLDVVTAVDGTEALDRLHTGGRPDVVLLDMGLPRCDGATTVREIRRDPAYDGLKIFAVSGHSPEEYDLKPGGIDHWFQKPINPAALVDYLHHQLDSTLCR